MCLTFAATAAFAQPPAKSTKPSAAFERLWVDYDVTETGNLGMRVHASFKTYRMKGVPSYLQLKFQMRDGKALMDKNGAFDHEDGSVAAFRVLKPALDAAEFKDEIIFVPYAELDLPPGKYELRIDVDVIHEDGELIEHLTLYEFDYTQPAKTTAPVKPVATVKPAGASATFERIWIDYDVTEGGKKGMRIHTAFSVSGMKSTASYLQIKFGTRDGTPLPDNNGAFVHEDGSVAAFIQLKPAYDSTVYEDEAIFMPYSELDLSPGRHLLTMDVDVIYEDGKLVSHLTNHNFEHTSR